MSQRLQLLQQILEKTPGDSFALFALAKEHEGLGDLPEALSFYRQLRESDPNYVGLYYHLGKLLERLNQPEEAILTYRAGMAIAKQMGDQHAWSELSAANMELDDDEDDDV